MNLGPGLNQAAWEVVQRSVEKSTALGIRASTLDCGTNILDFGVDVPGGLEAGIKLAEICTAGRATVEVIAGERSIWPGPWIQVRTDRPIDACMLSQYAGWPVKLENFFAMASGPMRLRRGREELLMELSAGDSQPLAVGTLECDRLPTCDVARSMAGDCNVDPRALWLAVAPTGSIAGCIQVVSRSVETALHKLHSLGFALEQVINAHGTAPVPPPTRNLAKGIGRTNDAILYGGHVTLWVNCDDASIVSMGPKMPSLASRDFGSPFAEIFARYNYDFYKVDPNLFSPAEISIINLRTGHSWRFGGPRPDLLVRSFETQIGSPGQ